MQDFVFRQAILSFTLRRFWNVVKSLSSFFLSIIMRKPIIWGIPPVLTVEPTNICNLKCPLCVTGNDTMLRSAGRMSFDTFRNIIDDIGDKIWYLILYHQGEPYINKDFLRCVGYAKEKGLYTETSTNVHYLNPQNAELTVQSGLDAVIVSVDGTTQESYERYRVNGKLDKVKEGIRNLVAAKKKLGSKTPYILLQFLVMKHNEHEIPEIEALARELGVDRLLKKNIQVENYQEALEWLPEKEKYQRYSVTDSDIQVRKGGKGVCPRPWLSTLMNWDGGIVPCCFDKNGKHSMGHAKDHDFEDIWVNGDYKEFRKNMLTNRKSIDICKNCNQGFGVWI